jgi:hypothetical protein
VFHLSGVFDAVAGATIAAAINATTDSSAPGLVTRSRQNLTC